MALTQISPSYNQVFYQGDLKEEVEDAQSGKSPTEAMEKESKDAEKEEVKHGQGGGSANVLLDKGDGDERRCLPEFASWRRLWRGCDGGIRSGHAPPAAVEEQSF